MHAHVRRKGGKITGLGVSSSDIALYSTPHKNMAFAFLSASSLALPSIANSVKKDSNLAHHARNVLFGRLVQLASKQITCLPSRTSREGDHTQ